MKQRIVVQAIVRSEDKVLLLRRSQGRPGLIGKYELPGGTLEDSEQPDDALRRHLHNDVGLVIDSPTLHDVMTMSSREESDIQHVLIVFHCELNVKDPLISLGTSYDKYKWQNVNDLVSDELRDSAQAILGVYNQVSHNAQGTVANSSNDVKRATTTSKVIIYSDGGSRGNPGPSAGAFVIMDQNRNVLDEGGEYLGITTNNQAEYQGVRLGLERALKLGYDEVEYRLDSMLVVNQLKGAYEIKNRELWPINERIRELLPLFKLVKFIHVPRELNHVADALVNKLLDEHQNDHN
jgi:ribonuclease HI/ADP-ribose pyrophosphatase YjhB (NUDIX family)